MSVLIRLARIEDAKSLLAIYKPYVEKTAITFEYDSPSLDSFQEKMRSILSFYPYLVAEENGKIFGYAYASPFHERPAYAWSAEATIYLDMSERGRGIGQLLYTALEGLLKEMGILNINACIAVTSNEDPHLTNASQRFHEALGYHLVGRFHRSGYKFDTWYDMIWMEKLFDNHHQSPQKLKSIHEIDYKKCLDKKIT